MTDPYSGSPSSCLFRPVNSGPACFNSTKGTGSASDGILQCTANHREESRGLFRDINGGGGPEKYPTGDTLCDESIRSFWNPWSSGRDSGCLEPKQGGSGKNGHRFSQAAEEDPRSKPIRIRKREQPSSRAWRAALESCGTACCASSRWRPTGHSPVAYKETSARPFSRIRLMSQSGGKGSTVTSRLRWNRTSPKGSNLWIRSPAAHSEGNYPAVDQGIRAMQAGV